MSKSKICLDKFFSYGVLFKRLSLLVDFKKGVALTKKDMTPGIYPVIAGGQTPAFYHNDFNRDGDIITISSSGAYSGFVAYHKDPVFLTDSFSVDSKDKKILLNKFIFYVLKDKQEQFYKLQSGGGVPHFYSKNIESLIIPVPPLEVQKDIVEILDKFTTLEAELEAELKIRNKQYEYYFEKLMNLSNGNTGFDYMDEIVKRLSPQGIEDKAIENIGKFRRGSFPQPYGLNKWYDEKNGAPFVQVVDVEDNQFLLVENTRRKISFAAQSLSVFAPEGTVIVTIQGTIGRIAITQYDAFIDRTLLLFTEIAKNINHRYLAYALKYKFEKEEKTARGSTLKTITIEELRKFKIPLPPLEIQNEIVRSLDIFSNIANSFTIGLPKEIELRKKQYEYYRNKLLTFEEK